MRLVSVVVAGLSLATGTTAWTKDGNGVWTANNNWHDIDGDGHREVHEACTVMGTTRTHTGPCAYFVNSQDKFRGHCAIVLGQGYTEIHCRS